MRRRGGRRCSLNQLTPPGGSYLPQPHPIPPCTICGVVETWPAPSRRRRPPRSRFRERCTNRTGRAWRVLLRWRPAADTTRGSGWPRQGFKPHHREEPAGMVGARASVGEAESYLGGLRARQGRPVLSIATATSATAIPRAMMVYRSNGLSMAPCRSARRRENSEVGAHREDGGVLAVPAARGGGWEQGSHATTGAPRGRLGRARRHGRKDFWGCVCG